MTFLLGKSYRNAKDAISKRETRRKVDYKPATFLQMMRYADRLDYFILAAALITSSLTGILIPFGSIVMAPINTAMIRAQYELDTTAYFDGDRLLSEVLSTVRNLLLTSACIFVAEYISKFSFYWLCERQTLRIRRHFLQAVLYKDAAWFDVNETGALTQKMASGIDRIKAGMSDKISTVIHAFSALVAGTLMALTVSWKMTFIMLAISPLLTISLCITSLALRRANKTEMSAYSKAGALANEVFAGIKTVISFNAQFFEISRYRERLDKAMKLGIRKAIITGICSATFALGFNVMFAVGYYAGVLLVFDGEMKSGEVFACFWAVGFGAMRIGQAVPNFNAIISAKMAAGDLFAIIDAPTQLDCTENGPGRCLKDVQGRIVVDDIHFAYPARSSVPVLKGVSFTIEAGQKVAFVGHSGCGKSTLASILQRFYAPSAGSVTVDGVLLEDLNARWLRQTIGCVSQEPVLFAATVGENLRLGEDDIPQTTIEAACRTANALDFILALPNGFDTLLGEGGVQLSGGQKQRLAIARALVRNPRILILDEATSALDTESEAVVQQALDSAAIGRTTISIAHRLSTIRNADMILVYEGGCIVERGTHDDLIAAEGIYAGLVQAQQLEEQRKDDFESDNEGTDDFHGSKALAEMRSSLRRSRVSVRLSKSMVNANIIRNDYADVEEGAIDEDAVDASLLDIIRFARPERKYLVFGVLGAVLTGVRYPLVAMLITQLFLIMSIPDVEVAKSELLIFFFESIALAIASGAASFISSCLLSTGGEKLGRRFRMKVFENLMRQDGYYFDQSSHAVGKLTARLASDPYNVQNAIDPRLADVLKGVTSLVVALILAFSYGANVTPYFLICSALLVTSQLLVAHYLKQRGRRDVMVAEEAARIASESIENILTVQALAKQDVVYKNFCRASVAPYKCAIARGVIQTLSFAISMAFGTINFSVCYGIGAYLIVNGYTRPYVVTQIVEALHITAVIILHSTEYIPEYVKARISVGIMFQMMSEQPRIDGMSEEGSRPEIEGDITFSKVKFSYPNRPQHAALDGLTFVAGKGKTVALVGPSGCGKSTIIRLLQRFYNTTGGSVMLDGTDTKGINVLHSRRAMAVVGQEPTLFNLTIKQNIVYGMLDNEVSDKEVEKAARLANVHDFIVSLPEGYETRIGAKGTQLSGGQRQRLAIARAVVRNPRILLLDEATSALDTQSEKLVQQALEAASEGRTCVIIAHRLSTVQRADIIVVVRDGKVVELGNHQQLLTRKGVYYRMVQKQKLV